VIQLDAQHVFSQRPDGGSDIGNVATENGTYIWHIELPTAKKTPLTDNEFVWCVPVAATQNDRLKLPMLSDAIGEFVEVFVFVGLANVFIANLDLPDGNIVYVFCVGCSARAHVFIQNFVFGLPASVSIPPAACP
jgi:hypothetical protein